MRNFLFTLAAFPFFSILTACGALVSTVDEEVDCTPEGTYPEYTVETWQTMSYYLPYCWTAETPSADQLILKDGDSEDQVFMHYHESDPETLGHVAEELDPDGKTLYLEYNRLESHEIELILTSVAWPSTHETQTP